MECGRQIFFSSGCLCSDSAFEQQAEDPTFLSCTELMHNHNILSLRVESESTKTLLGRGSTGHRGHCVTSYLLPFSGSFTDVRSQYLLSIAGIVNICPWLLFTLITSLFRQKLSSAGENQEILFSSYLGTLKYFQNVA